MLLLLSAVAAGFCSSCATSRGFGQDLQKIGSRIETNADESGGATPPPGSTAPVVPAAY